MDINMNTRGNKQHGTTEGGSTLWETNVLLNQDPKRN